ncbi:MAG: LLM class flavin-dependent oxidoreductase [Pseudomonadota bacterium]
MEQTVSMRFGLMLSNRGPVLGYAKPNDLVELGVQAERSGYFDTVWSGDAFLVNPRLDAIALLTAVAARTDRVELAPACMGSFTQRAVLDLAYSWASLDQIAGGRTFMVACVGGGSAAAWARESSTTGVTPRSRRAMMWERIDVLRQLWSGEAVNVDGDYHTLTDAEIAPIPLRTPYPIWAATNLTRLASGSANGALPEKTLAIVGTKCDGWMTHSVDAETFDTAWNRITDAAEQGGRDARALDNALVLNLCVDDDANRALETSSNFLEAYYGIRFSAERTRAWTAFGSPAQCAEAINRYRDSKVRRLALRITSPDQTGQFERLVNDVLPRLR